MESKRFFRKGEVTETPSGEKALVNEDGSAYAVTDTILTVWGSFDGNTVEEVAVKIGEAINREPGELMGGINEMATELEKADLLCS